MADVFDSGERVTNGLSIEGETMDLNQLKGLFTEWLDSDVQDGVYRWGQIFNCHIDQKARNPVTAETEKQRRKSAPLGFLNLSAFLLQQYE